MSPLVLDHRDSIAIHAAPCPRGKYTVANEGAGLLADEQSQRYS